MATIAAVIAAAAPGRSAAGCGTVPAGTPTPASDPASSPAFRVEIARRIVTYGDAFGLWTQYSWRCEEPRPAGDPVVELRAVGEQRFRPAAREARLLVRNEPLAAGVTAGTVTWEIAPTVTAEYRVSWGGRAGEPIRMVVRPALTLRRSGRGFLLSVSAARDYAGRRASVQRVFRGRWTTTRVLTVGAGSRVRFSAGRAGRLRVLVPSAFGYAPAVSRVVRA